jgi:hypothetical protein
MGFATIRAAIGDYLVAQQTAGNLGSVASISPAPQALNSADVFANLAESSAGDAPGVGAAVWIYLQTSDSTLYAAPTNYADLFSCELIVLALDTSGDAVNAQAIADNALDELRAMVKASRTVNAPDVVFVWGVGDLSKAGSLDIHVAQDLPTLVGSTTAVLVAGSVTVNVIQLTPQQG